jgi:hypothetical protein
MVVIFDVGVFDDKENLFCRLLITCFGCLCL